MIYPSFAVVALFAVAVRSQEVMRIKAPDVNDITYSVPPRSGEKGPAVTDVSHDVTPLGGEMVSVDTGSGANLATGTLPPDISASLSGEALAFETGSGGDVYVYLSPDVQKDLNGVMQSKCGNTPTSDCEQAIQNVLEQNSVDIQKRFIDGGLAVVGVVALVSIVIESMYTYGKDEPRKVVPSALRLPPSQLAEVTTWATATSSPTAIVVDDLSTTFTVSVPNGPTTATGLVPDATVLTSAPSGHSSGDALITMPTPLALKAQQILADSSCTTNTKKMKRVPGADCLFTGATNLMAAAYPGGPLHDLLLIQHNVPLFRNPDVVRATGQMIALARQLAPQLQVSPQQAATFGAVAVALAWEVIANNQQLGPSNYLPASALTTGDVPSQDITLPPSASVSPTASQTSSSRSGCPGPDDDALVCQSAYCSGDLSKSTCATGTLNRCPCTAAVRRGQLQTAQYNTTLGDIQQRMLNSLISEMVTVTPMPVCNFTTAQPGFDGTPTVTPASWCFCSQSPYPVNSIPYSTGIYSVLNPKATGPSACAYTTMPPTPISIVSPTGTPIVTSCRFVTTSFTSVPSGAGLTPNVPYTTCTCNDGSGSPPLTTAIGGTTTTYCSGALTIYYPPCQPQPTPPTSALTPFTNYKCPPFVQTR